MSHVVVRLVKEQSVEMPKTIVYRHNINRCSLLYGMFMNHLDKAAYAGGSCEESYRTRIVAMYQHSTNCHIKDHVVSTFTSKNSVIRTVFATDAFGMGVDAPDVSVVVHYGAARSMMAFAQESERAGRDCNIQAVSVVYYHMLDTTVLATDTAFQEYCRSK